MYANRPMRKSLAWRGSLTLALACLACWVGTARPALGQEGLRTSANASTVVVQAGEKPVAEYQYVENPRKPYLAKLFSPAGIQVLRDSPADHKHHHGLMFALAVDGVDFWSETETCGRQRHEAGQQPFIHNARGFDVAVGTQELQWIGPGEGKLLLRETRTLGLARLPDSPATLVGWRSKLEVPPGKNSVTLGGSAYFGLGMRFVEAMDRGGKFHNAEAKTGVEGTNAARSAWCAYSAAVDGKPVTVVMASLPGNVRHPATWFTMDQPFAYLAATLDLAKQPLVIEAGKPLVLRYAVVACDGSWDKAKIDSLVERLGRWAAADKAD